MKNRRRLAQVLRDLAREVVGADVDDSEFAPIALAVEPWVARLAALPRLERDASGLHTAGHAGKRSGLEPAYDRDPLIGLSNPMAPPLVRLSMGETTEWEITFGDVFEGHPGLAHGGFVAAIIDHVLGVTSSSAGAAAMTGTLTVRYRRPTPLHKRLVCRGKTDRIEGRKVFCSSELLDGEELIAEGEGVYLRVDPDRY